MGKVKMRYRYRTGDVCPHDGTPLVLNGMIPMFNQANMSCGTCGYTKPVKIECVLETEG